MWSSFVRRPLALFLILFSLGVYTAVIIKIHLWLIFSGIFALIVLSFFSLKKGLRFDLLLFALVFSFGAAVLSNQRILPGRHFLKYIRHEKDILYTIRGYVDSQPAYKDGGVSFVFQARNIRVDNFEYACCGRVLVQLKGDKEFRYAEALILRGSLSRPFRSDTEKSGGYREYLYRQGIFYIMRVPASSLAIRLNYFTGPLLQRLAFKAEDQCRSMILRYMPDVPASILSAMVLGERRGIPALVNDSMIKSGTVHILVVSGFNVGLVVFVFILLLKLARLSRKARVFCVVPLVLLYCLMTGASNSVIRATVMALVFILAYIVKREADIYNSLAVAAICILAVNPMQLFDIGCQLSFASVFSIACFYPRIKTFLRIDRLRVKSLKYLIEGFVVSLSAWLGTAGFIAHYFRIVSPVAVIANIFIVPLASFITLCGFGLIIAGFLFRALAPFFAYSSEFAIALLLRLNAFLIQLPGAYFYLP